MEERLSKLLSRYGVASRRQAEEWIKAGRVTVNGVPALLGQKADDAVDEVAVDGIPLTKTPPKRCLMLHKPRGYVTTLSDEQGRPTVAELVKDCGYRLYPVGRLDLNSEGLLLMTNDGDLANHLTHPSHEVEKEYQVRVTGPVRRALPMLRKPMEIDGEQMQGATPTPTLSPTPAMPKVAATTGPAYVQGGRTDGSPSAAGQRGQRPLGRSACGKLAVADRG